jgi:membrane fusion protein, macrolide-specific efflux system
MRTRGWKLTSGALALACVGGGVLAYRSVRPSTNTAAVRTVTATLANVSEVVSGTGTVEAGSTRTITPATQGELLELNVGVGDWVEANAVIAVIDPRLAQRSLDQAQASLRQATARQAAVLEGLTAAERQQLQISAASSQSSIKQAQESLRAAQETARNNRKSYDQSVSSSRRSVTEAAATAEVNDDLSLNQMISAEAAIETAKTNAEVNARSYQSQVDTAKANLDSAQSTAALNAKSYQAAVDNAETNAKNTQTNVDLSNVSAQAQLDQAVAQLGVVQAALGVAQGDLGVATSNYVNAQTSETTAKSAYDRALAAVVAPATCESTPACNQALSAWRSAQTAVTQAKSAFDSAQSRVTSAQNSVTQQQNTITNLTNSRNATTAKDQQSITAASGPQVQSAKQAQEAGLAKDAQAIRTAETTLQNALASQAAGLQKDQSAIESAQLALSNLEANQRAADIKETQTATNAQQSVDNAVTARTSGKAKDQQSVTSAENQLRQAQQSYQQLLLSNQVKLAPAKAADLESAAAAVFSAEVAVSDAKDALEGTTVRAPIAGTITALNAEVGQTVGASGAGAAATANAFATIVNTRDLRVRLGVSEANAAKLKAEQFATVTFDALPNVSAQSFVIRVDPVAATANNVATYPAYLQLADNAWEDGVKPGMTAQVRVTVNEVSDVVTLPASAIRSVGGRSVVFVFDPKTKTQTRTRVTLGVKGEGGTEIVEGIEEGTLVALPEVQATTVNPNQLPGGLGGAGGGRGGLGGGAGGAGGGGPRG